MGSKLIALFLLIAGLLLVGGCEQKTDTANAAQIVEESMDKGGPEPDPNLPKPMGASGARSPQDKFSSAAPGG